jgi:DNA (cytosine-5)-methyltransferase 1
MDVEQGVAGAGPVSVNLLGPLDGLTADQINVRFQQLIADTEWGSLPPLDEGAFAAIVQDLERRPRLFTFVDLFCGAGGSSTGLTMAGGLLLFAANHSKRNVATHAENYRNAEHACVDLDHYDMRNIPAGADVLWASPICTELSPAGGNGKGKGARKRPVRPEQEELLKFGPVAEEEFIRTRATFLDVIRATEVHEFKYVIVENVVEAAWKWRLFGWWLDGMAIASRLGYGWQIVSASAAHVGDALNPHAPQRRDRMYVVFHRLDCPKPDLELRPLAKCHMCGLVEGFQVFKKPKGTLTASGRLFKVGKYGIRNGQYVYKCPNGACRHSTVTPLERPAAAVIDWNDLGVPIAERAQHGLPDLVPNTLRRIGLGVRLFARPVTVAAAGNTYERPGSGYVRAWPADQTPFMAQQATNTTGLAWPPFVDACGGSWNTEPYPVDQPFRTRMANPKGFEALVVPGSFTVNHAHDDDRLAPVDWQALPAATTKIGHGVVFPHQPEPFPVKNYSDSDRPQDRVVGVDQALGTVTTGRNQSLVVPDGSFVDTMRNNTKPTSAQEAMTGLHAGGNAHALVVPYNRTAVATRADTHSMPTMTTVDRAGLASGFDDEAVMADVMKARYRTLWWYEQALAQRFPASYVWTGNAGERTAGAGNAVASNVACWLGQRIAAALNRTAASAGRVAA